MINFKNSVAFVISIIVSVTPTPEWDTCPTVKHVWL